MHITQIEKVADCLDGKTYILHFDQPWNRVAILELAAFGDLEYFPDFPRPFYRLRGRGSLQVKGVEGLQHCRVLVDPGQREHFARELEARLKGI